MAFGPPRFIADPPQYRSAPRDKFINPSWCDSFHCEPHSP